jgi:dipeptidyl aminopeptidase/acylaminoacyl peptidase
MFFQSNELYLLFAFNQKTVAMKKSLLFLLLFMLMIPFPAAVAQDNVPPLLDRELFYGDPQIAGAQISPDGNYISFMRPYEGTRNLWVKTLEADFDDALPVTNRTDRPIMGYFWSRDGKYLLFVMDQGGDENFNIYALDPKEAAPGHIPEARNLTNLEEVRAQIFHVSRIDPDLLFIGLNDRDKAWHDLYSLRLSTGELVKMAENTNRYLGWLFDHEDRLRLAARQNDSGDNELWRIDPDGSQSLIYEWALTETANPYGFHKDNQRIYLVTNKGPERDLTELYLMDINTGEKTFMERDPEGRADFGGILISDKTMEPVYTSYTDDRTRIYFMDKEYEGHYNFLKEQLGDVDVRFASATTEEDYFLVNAFSDVTPASTYLFHKDSRTLTFQFSPRGDDLPSEYMSHMVPIRYPSSDGLEIPAFLTLPKGFGETNLPLVVVPHGGPWARDFWGFNTQAQFLANRGYAVLQPNFRGSTGFGKSFLNAGNLEWGDLMQDDITWGVKYLVDQGIADPERIAIFGGSYGGYATLAGLAFTPDLYAAGVSFVGPSNLITLLNSIPPYWEAARKVFHERMGDPSNEEGKQQLIRQSPLFSADKIVAPLMVVQGQNDPRVKKTESDQIVVALRDRGFPVEYLNAPDEGHGFARPENNMAFVAAKERFLAKHIGGRYQEDMPENIAQRLQEITVDVNTVTLPEELSQEERTIVIRPVRPLQEGDYAYEISLNMMGQEMKLNQLVSIKREGDKIIVTETSQTPMGEAVDRIELDAASLQPRQRSVKQGATDVNIGFSPEKAEGSIVAGGQTIPVSIELESALFAEGPGAAFILGTLPLAEEYRAIYSNTDLNSMSVKTFRLVTTSDVLEDGREAWKVETAPADGGPGGITIWFDPGRFVPLRFEQILPEAGGAVMVGVLKE